MGRSRRNQRRRRIVGGESTDRTMHLSRHDLAQLDEVYLAGLPEGSLRVLSVKLLIDLKELFERLDQNPSNSSRPPSSRAPWEGVAAGEEWQETPEQSGEAPAAEDTQETAPPAAEKAPEAPPPKAEEPRRPGRRPGAPGHGRTQCLEVHAQQHHHPEVCAACGAPSWMRGSPSARSAPITSSTWRSPSPGAVAWRRFKSSTSITPASASAGTGAAPSRPRPGRRPIGGWA